MVNRYLSPHEVHVLMNVGLFNLLWLYNNPTYPLMFPYIPLLSTEMALLPCIFFDSIRKDFQCDVGYLLGDATAPGVSKKDSHL